MKIGEKLIELRKKNGLSQEDLAERLDVTRQTISKWELGNSKPDIEKIKLISKEFDIPVNELMDEEVTIEKEKMVTATKEKNRKGILYLFWILLIICIGVLGYRLLNGNGNGDDEKSSHGIFSIFSEIFDNTDFTKTRFNGQFELYAGENYGSLLEGHIADLITNNKKNKDHLIEFIMDEISFGTDPDEIQKQKETISSSKKYELLFNYDEEGYINQFIVKTKNEDKSVSSTMFNNKFEYHSGEDFGLTIRNLITEVVNSNQKYSDHQIELVLFGSSYGNDSNEMIKAGKKLADWTKYNIMFNYDENGFINKLIIEK